LIHFFTILDKNLIKQLNHRLAAVFILNPTVCKVRKNLDRISQNQVTFFNLQLSQRHTLVKVVLAFNSITEQNLSLFLFLKHLKVTAGAELEKIENIMLRWEISSFKPSSQRIMLQKNRKKAVILINQIRLELFV